MSISAKESELFSTWQHNRKGFVCDGVVSENDYLNSAIKLCFVLKEVNDPDGGHWDLREYIKEGARHQTWNNIARWVFCIRNLDSEIKWSELEPIDDEFRRNALRSICAFNLKKSPGGHTTELASFGAVILEDKNYIINQ